MWLASKSGRLKHNVFACFLEININSDGSSFIKLEERDWLVRPQWSGILHPFDFPGIIFLGSELVEWLGHLESLKIIC